MTGISQFKSFICQNIRARRSNAYHPRQGFKVVNSKCIVDSQCNRHCSTDVGFKVNLVRLFKDPRYIFGQFQMHKVPKRITSEMFRGLVGIFMNRNGAIQSGKGKYRNTKTIEVQSLLEEFRILETFDLFWVIFEVILDGGFFGFDVKVQIQDLTGNVQEPDGIFLGNAECFCIR